MNPIPVFVPRISPRLSYVLGWLFEERIGTGFRIVTSEAEAVTLPFCIAYGTALSHCLSIPDTGLLWEQSVRPQAPAAGTWQDLPVIFSSPATSYTLQFDLFSALFFHISRYEEYLPYTPDKHGRYPAAESLLYKSNCLERPLADEWIQAFRLLLQQEYNLPIPTPTFSFQPTYDIDIAWSYKHKGWKRATGAMLKDLLTGNFSAVKDRLATGAEKKKDPYDAFDTMQAWHHRYGLHPYYFILASLRTTAFDKNISPGQPAMQALIRRLASDGAIGIHPSYYSDQYPQYLSDEKKQLENILRKEIVFSRQHYIRMKLPDTCQMLLRAGITDDFSIGYGTHLGFRAATGESFLWYDLTTESVTTLRLHPFCFMDTTARYETGLTAIEAFTKLEQTALLLKTTHSRLITIFHNFSLGTDPEWDGWAEAYHGFLQQQSESGEKHC